jgi:putative ABC transport system ATP-binding protein
MQQQSLHPATELNLSQADGAPSAVPIVRLDNISKVYGVDDLVVYALSGIHLTIHQGEYCAIMGASGSGKSTAMNIIGCLDRPTTGAYYLEEQNVAHLTDTQLAHIRNQKLGFVFQQFHLLSHLSALDNVMLPMIYANVSASERRQRAVKALEQVGLANRLYNRPNQLSGGQQQRVAIARAIVNQPILLLADEPTGALDSHTTQEVLNIFSALNQGGITLVVVTHEVEVARQAKRIIWFKDGEIVQDNVHPQDLAQLLMD